MTEINKNNIHNFGFPAGKIENNKVKDQTKEVAEPNIDKKEPEYIRDTGVLGRSQIVSTKGADVSKSVDEAVNVMKNHPEFAEKAEMIFDKTYENLLLIGLSETEAYVAATEARDEFMEAACAHKSA